MTKHSGFRRLLATGLLAVTAMAIAACSGKPSPASGNSAAAAATAETKVTEIEFYHIHGGVQEEAVNKLIDAYHKSQDKVRVKPIYVPKSYEGILEKVQTMVAARQYPDVVQAGFVYTQFMIENMPVTPVSRFIDAEKFDTSDFYPSMLDLGKDNKGQLWGLPFAVSTPIVYFNADHFKAAGLDPTKPPKTWDELRAAAKKLTTPEHYGIWFNYDITGNWLFQAMVETAGGRMIGDDAKRVRFDEQAGTASLQYWVDLINTDRSMPLLKGDQAQKQFEEGKISMLVSTTAGLAGYTRNAKFDLRTALFPTTGSNPRRVPAGGNNVFIMAKDPERQKAAWDFIKFATGPKATTIVAQGMGYMANRKSAVATPELMGDFLSKSQNAKTTYEQVGDMVPWYNFPGKAGTRIYKLVQDNMEAAFLKQKEPAQALKDAATEANALLK